MMSAGTIYTNRIIESAQAFLLRTKHRLSLCIMSQGTFSRGIALHLPRRILYGIVVSLSAITYIAMSRNGKVIV
ncbi:hypothetical protein Y032_0014g2253 [Ancylostoma ceylanicum]|uniref:Uncharacterized protein n=1 Tax=Ancylostoma ceylanicum TaxID=53326 RepID=A0A016V8K4_9BILA|nr:hypothetical protein Y032_0014g2253 [Ancylostoma ceylanicum]